MALTLGNSGTNVATIAAPTAGMATSANAVTVLWITYYSAGPAFASTGSITDPDGITWHLRRRTTLKSNYPGAGTTLGDTFITQECWWSFDTAIHNRIITFNVVNPTGVDKILWVQQDVGGSLTPNAPWDDSSSLEAAVQTFSDPTALAAPSVSGNVSQANSMVFAMLSEETSAAASALAATGATWTATNNNTSGTSPDQLHMFLENKVGSGAFNATTTTTKPAFIFSMDAISGTSIGSRLTFGATSAERPLRGKKDKSRPYTARRDQASWRNQTFARVRGKATPDPGPLWAIAGTPVTGGTTAAAMTLNYSVPANSLVIAHVHLSGFTGTGFATVSTVTDSAGNTWHRRRQTKLNSLYAGAGSTSGLIFLDQEIWWTYAAAAQVATTLTVNVTGNTNEGIAPTLMIFGVSGVQNPAAPWDDGVFNVATYSNASVKSGALDPTYTTNENNSMVLSFLTEFMTTAASNPSTVGANETLVTSVLQGTNPNQILNAVQWKKQFDVAPGDTPWVDADGGKIVYIIATDALSGSAFAGSAADLTPVAPDGNATGSIIVVTDSLISGVATGNANASGQVLSVSDTVINGTVTGTSAASGSVIVVADSIISGSASGTANVSGQVLSVSDTIVDGVASGNANASGSVIVVTDSLLSGSASGGTVVNGNASGDIIVVTDSIVSGAATGGGNASGDVLVVADSIVSGTETGTGSVGGSVIITTASLIDGLATGDGNVSGQVVSDTTTIVDGVAHGDANANGDLIVVTAFIVTPDATVAGQVLVVTISLLEGTAAEVVFAPPIGGGGMHFANIPPPPKPVNAMAFGVNFEITVTLLPGYATGATNLEFEVLPPIEIPTLVLPAVVVGPQFSITIEGQASGDVQIEGALLEHRDWTNYDNEFLLAA